jgi:FMN phosphatase YigB (HAD superfamily)
MDQVKVIVSDLGKVLLQFEVQRVWDALHPHFDVDLEEARQIVQAVFKETRYGAGGIDSPGFYRRLVERTGLKLPYDAFAIAWSDMFWEDGAVIRLVSEAPVDKRYLLSNTNDLHWEWLKRNYGHVLDPFDRLVVSHELQLEKPDCAIYEWVIRDSGYAPEEHLFIDDIPENVAGAQAVGMQAVVHTDSVSLWREFLARGLATEAQKPEHVEVVIATPPDLAVWSPDADADES